MELKFSPSVYLDKRLSFVKFQVDPLSGLNFTRRFPNYLANPYNLGSTSSIVFKFGPMVPILQTGIDALYRPVCKIRASHVI